MTRELLVLSTLCATAGCVDHRAPVRSNPLDPLCEVDCDAGAEGEGEGQAEGEGEGGDEGEGEGEGSGEGEGETCEPAVEVCDGLDNDCDGHTDEEDPDAGRPCDTGEPGPCARGTRRCEDGRLVCLRDAEPSEETCNGMDDDCDGLADEDNPDGGARCDTGQAGVCADGTQQCERGGLRCLPDLTASPEVCDGLDNDCDGAEDEEDPGGGVACDTGEPAACRDGTTHCRSGEVVCERDVEPSDEVCDGLDNDCDGEVDDGAAPDGWSCVPPTGPEGFLMGSPEDEPGRQDNEGQHLVVLTAAFLMRRTEVTQAEWQAVVGNGLQLFDACGMDCPIGRVSWLDAVAYVNALSADEGLEQCYVVSGSDVAWPRGARCLGYRLPTEAEWEWAARAGTVTPFYAGSYREDEEAGGCGPVAALDDAGWYCGNADGTSHVTADVESLPSVCNPWGLCDMLGNVHEWVWDPYHDTYGALDGPDDVVDPTGPGAGETRVFRGGSWAGQARYLRSAARNQRQPGSRGLDVGFRPVRTPTP